LPKNWTEHEKAFNELMRIMCQKVQCQLLAGRPGGTAGSQEEPVRVEDERVDNDNQDDGAGWGGRFWRRTTGGVRRRRRRRRNNIRFNRTMLMSLISFISSTGV